MQEEHKPIDESLSPEAQRAALADEIVGSPCLSRAELLAAMERRDKRDRIQAEVEERIGGMDGRTPITSANMQTLLANGKTSAEELRKYRIV